jgi:hypothetical protein
MSSNSHTAIDTFIWMIQEAFEGDPAQSLLANLEGLEEKDWAALPPGAGRSIGEILEHVGWAKWMYTDYAFGPGSMRGDQPPLTPEVGASEGGASEGGAAFRPPQELLTWLGQGHRQWLAAVRDLPDDAELERPRLTNWGEFLPTRDLIRILIAHDFYHAGEINHLRALIHGTDRWPY